MLAFYLEESILGIELNLKTFKDISCKSDNQDERRKLYLMYKRGGLHNSVLRILSDFIRKHASKMGTKYKIAELS